MPFGSEGFFFLFGLDLSHEEPTSRRRALQRHPGEVPVEHLFPLVQGLTLINTVTSVILLPSGDRLVPTKVQGLAIPTGDAAHWLLGLEQAPGRLPPDQAPGRMALEQASDRLLPDHAPGLATDQPPSREEIGRSLQVWSAAARLLLERLEQGRILPRLRVEAGCLTTAWELVPPSHDEAERLDGLAAALPHLCLAIVPPDRSHTNYTAPEAGALLDRFAHEATNALVVRLLADAPRPLSPLGGQSALRHWLLALTGQAPRDLPPGLVGAAELYEAVSAWLWPASGVQGLSRLRSGVRVNPPGESQHGGWELELILQTDDQPATTIPAEVVWEAVGEELVVGHQRFEGGEQRLLHDLPELARLYPPLQRLRSETLPTRLPVKADAVVQLLQEGAQRLQEAGFVVHLPTGLVRKAGLRASMRLKPRQSNTESRFGLEQTVTVDWELALGGQAIDWAELERLAKEKSLLVQSQGNWIQVDPKVIQAALQNLEPHRHQIELRTAVNLAAQVGLGAGDGPVGVDGSGGADRTGLIIEATGEGWVQTVLDRLQEPAQIEPLPPPQGLKATLRPYQERGFHWLAFLRQFGFGAILADDMGLGKTIQVIALLLYERAEGWTHRPTLLVCPVSLVGNWRREVARFAPGLRVLIHHGSGRAGDHELRELALQHDLVITTYALAARDEAELAQIPWAGLVVDEAQNLKNPAVKHAQALRRFLSAYRIALTGTPVENHLGDLWALFHFTNPGLLGSQEHFRKSFAQPIEREQDRDATERLRRLIQPFMLRRVKTDPAIIDDLPEKQENSVYVTLTMEQAALYEAVVEETMNKALGLAGIARHGAVLAGLTRLKQVCNHPAGLTADGGPLEGRSGKLDRLTEMLDEVVAEGEAALIFTQFARFGSRLREYLARRFNCTVFFLDGSVVREERERMIQAFQSGEAPIFVLSLKAGGVGLNLTRASHVFHFDRWWNPAVEDQATDRAFRIGQTQRVMVHRLVTAGTLEERIDELLTEKRLLSQQVVATGESWLGDLSTDELRQLITLEASIAMEGEAEA